MACLSPFETSRYFFAARPVAVSPIGIGVLFTKDAVYMIASEVKRIWLPTVSGCLID